MLTIPVPLMLMMLDLVGARMRPPLGLMLMILPGRGS